MFSVFKWLKTSIETLKWKIDSIWTSILREIDVDLTSMYRKKQIAYKNMILEICVFLATKTDVSINVSFWLSFFETR